MKTAAIVLLLASFFLAWLFWDFRPSRMKQYVLAPAEPKWKTQLEWWVDIVGKLSPILTLVLSIVMFLRRAK